MQWILIITFYVTSYGSETGRIPMKLTGFPSSASCQAAAKQISQTLGGPNDYQRRTLDKMACIYVPSSVS